MLQASSCYTILPKTKQATTMDKLDAFGLFLINIVLAVILATMLWGKSALILFGLVMAPLYLTLLLATFIECAFGFSPLRLLAGSLMRR